MFSKHQRLLLTKNVVVEQLSLSLRASMVAAANASSLGALEASTFGFSERFPDLPADMSRPHAYRGFTPLLEAARGRAVSAIGTFSTSQRSQIGSRATADISFYEFPEKFTNIKHSRGVKRSEPRFREFHDDASPGPIYKPFGELGYGAPAMKFSRAPRFPSSNVQSSRRSSTPVSPVNKRPESQNSSSRCTFGIRHDHLELRLPAPATPLETAKDTVGKLPPYSGKFGTSSRSPGREASLVTPGPGHFLKAEFVSNAPSHTIGRPRRPQRSETPGPGAYRIDKYKPVNKPRGETFARVGHNILRDLPGLDSPGPALYSKLREHVSPQRSL